MQIKVNNIKINYTVAGKGTPIILLHGNSENYMIFDKLIDSLKSNYTVYAIDSRCHGKSEDTKEISYELMAEDVIEFIQKLNIIKPVLYGFSDGGIIGLLIAIKKPELLSKLIISGANISPNAMSTFTIVLMKIIYFFTKDKLIKLMLFEPNISTKELNQIIVPTHILVGEKDAIKLEHTKLIQANIRNSTLEIIPKENHSSYIIHSDKIYNIIKKYI